MKFGEKPPERKIGESKRGEPYVPDFVAGEKGNKKSNNQDTFGFTETKEERVRREEAERIREAENLKNAAQGSLNLTEPQVPITEEVPRSSENIVNSVEDEPEDDLDPGDNSRYYRSTYTKRQPGPHRKRTTPGSQRSQQKK